MLALRRLAVAALVVLATAGVLVPAASRDAGAAVPTAADTGFSPGSMILWGSNADLARDLDGMKATGATWVRVDFDWPSIQPTATTWNWAHTDRVVHAALARGLQVLALPTFTPAWQRPAGTSDKHAPNDPEAFAAFAREAVERYAPLGVKHWEIWNEANIQGFWQPRPDPVAYTRLLVAAAREIRAADPAATVLSTGTAPAGGPVGSTHVDPGLFLSAIYANGGASSFDAVAHHPYSYPVNPLYQHTHNAFWGQTQQIRAIMVAQGDGAKEIWGTEFGAPTGTGARSVSEATQAAHLTEAYASWAAWTWTGPLLWYAWRDAGSDLTDLEDNFGLVRRDYTPKLALAAMQAVTGGVPGTTTTTTTAAPTTTTTVAPAPTTTAPAPAPAPSGGFGGGGGSAPAPTTTTTTTAPTPRPSRPGPPTPTTTTTASAYRTVQADGTLRTFGPGDATLHAAGRPVAGAAVHGAVRPGGAGHWVVDAAGTVDALGGAPDLGDLGGHRLRAPIVGMAATPTGRGYWLVASDGGIFSFGDAAFHGSTGAIRLNQPIVGMSSTPSGRGYHLVARDGGIFSFGDAAFHGSTGAIRLNQPIVGMSSTPTAEGYWLVARDGGIFTFGDAAYRGSTGGLPLRSPVVGIATTASGRGYRIATRDGAVFAFGDATLHGVPGPSPVPVVAIA